MARKQNGWGNSKSLVFKDFGRIDKGKNPGAPGNYPSNRRYGTSVQRTVIEKYNLDSDWTKWRRGMEYAYKAAWYRLQAYDPITNTTVDQQIQSKLYQGTAYETDVVFDGYKYATKGSDSNNHYVIKRTVVSNPDIGNITSVLNDDIKYPENKKNREIWVQGNVGADARVLLQMIAERLTDGETEATLTYVLNSDAVPALYIGKSTDEGQTKIKSYIKKDKFMATDWAKENNLFDLVGKIVYVKDFFIEKGINTKAEEDFKVTDDNYSWTIDLNDDGNSEITILENNNLFPPSIYDISTLPAIYNEPNGRYTIKGQYIYDKNLYQRFYKKTFVTGELVRDSADTYSYSVMPYVVEDIREIGNEIELTSVPYTTELKLYLPITGDGYLVFTDYSFTKTTIDEYDGKYYHAQGKPGDPLWMKIDTDVDPWMDEVFTTGNPLSIATTYTCSCPNHSQSILRAPQQFEDDNTRKINRQRRYPLPTVKGKKDFDQIGLAQASGLVESWESREHKMSFKMCKHSIAAMFNEKIKVQEPNKYPTLDARKDFEEKLAIEMAEVGAEFDSSYKRGGVTALEVVFALAQGLNLDEVETAYVVLNSNF
ncbi:MAG: hypothetical protein CMM25_09820 [Rhodospirillaceae bacterium]|nr:hypothetical protein [Rhodospirillaceae bacterium]